MSEVRDVLRAIQENLSQGRPMALGTIVAAHGSTYRREGARLLVHQDGKMVGNISGGCLEGEIREVAFEVMSNGTPRLLHYDLTADDEAIWGWGLGCNGIIDVFVEPAEGAAATAGALERAIERQEWLAAVTVVESPANGTVAAGARMLVRLDGSTEGSLGDGLDAVAVDEGRRALEDERSGLADLAPGVRAFVEAFVPPPRLVVCGAGHDVIPLVGFASQMGWRVDLTDEREGFLKEHRFPGATSLVKAAPIDAASAVGADDRTYVTVMSHNYLRDKDYLRSFLGTPVRYIGMLGPGARLDRLLATLADEGFVPQAEDMDVVHGPAGLDLGGDGPEEVAWAILAELMAVRNGRDGGFLKDRRAPIHDRKSGRQSVASPG